MDRSALGESDRMRLARLAVGAAAAQPGVAGTARGPLGAHLTATRDGGPLQGVVSAAAGAGRYEIALCLIAEPVNLLELGAAIRVSVQEVAAQAGLAERLGDVNVHFADLSAVAPLPTR